MKQPQKLSPPQIHRSLALKTLIVSLFVVSTGNITFSLRETNTIEVSLEYLLGSLEIWGSWLDPANEIGLLPEAEGRFMFPSTPILQTGGTTLSGNIGVAFTSSFQCPISKPRSFLGRSSKAPLHGNIY